MSRVLTVTLNPCIDVSTAIESLAPERKLRCEEPRFEPGGGGLNVARAISYLGGSALAVWTRAGPSGQSLHQLLDEEGLEHQPVDAGGRTRQNLTVAERSSRRLYRFVMPGPQGDPADLNRVIETLSNLVEPGTLVVASGSVPTAMGSDAYARIAEAVRAGEGLLVLDTSGPALSQALEGGVYLVKMNLREAREASGQALDHEPEIEEAARDLVAAQRASAVVISLGAGGAIYAGEHNGGRVTAPTVRISSRVGAGDSMVAGMVLALTEGAGLEEAVVQGVASGSAAVMTPGTQLCRRQDTEHLLQVMTG